jgi:hypothetical protein
MLHYVAEILVMFQRTQLTCGGSMQHARDMDAVRNDMSGDARPRSPSRTKALLASPTYPALLQGLEVIIEIEAKRKLCPKERQELDDMIRLVADLYYNVPLRLSELHAFLNGLRGLAAPLARAIEILEANREGFINLLGRHAVVGDANSVQEAISTIRKQEVSRYEIFLSIAREIAACTGRLPQKRDRKQAPKSDDLKTMVGLLALYWKQMTGKRITQDWQDRIPLTSATQFVHAVVGFIDVEALNKLPYVTRLVAEAQGIPRDRED